MIAAPGPRRLALALALLGAVFGAIACQNIAGLGEFSPQDDATSSTGRGGAGDGGGDGDGGRDASGGGDGGAGDGGVGGVGGSGAPPSSSSASSTVTTSTGGGCTLDHLVISEVRTRGPSSGNQDFIEIFNPTSAQITLGADHHVDARGEDSSSYGERWRGDVAPITIPAGGRALLANQEDDNPLGGADPDGTYESGIPDGASVVLYEGSTVIDAVCFTCQGQLDEDFVCEGAPLSRSSTCDGDGDVSVQRKPGEGVDGCTDTDDGSADLTEGPSNPEGTG